MKNKYFVNVMISLPITFITYTAVMYFLNYLTDGVGSVDLRQSVFSAIIISLLLPLWVKKKNDKKIKTKE